MKEEEGIKMLMNKGDIDVNDEEDIDTGNRNAGQDMTQLESQVRQHIEGACMSLQNNDIQGVLAHLDLALSMLRGNTNYGLKEYK